MNAAAQGLKKIVTNESRHFSVGHYTPLRSLLMGGGICYALADEKYHHIPVTFFMPSAYAGYQLFNNKDAAADWVRRKTHGVPPADTSATIKATCPRHVE